MKDVYKFIIFTILGALCLMIDAFYNGFPLVYSDTSTYIASGFELETPFDRPITYGLFLRLFSLNGLSLWLVIFFQALLLSYLLFLLIKLITNNKSFLQLGIITILILSLFTGVSWTVSQLMPDIFTSTALLSLILILLGKFKRGTLIFLYLIFVISVAMHLSHILMFGLILLLIYSFKKIIVPQQKYPNSVLKITILFLLTIFSVVTMGAAISKSKHVFFMGAMVEHGIVKNYLDDHCDTKTYKLCNYKDSLPEKAYQFIWDEKSPFYKIGGWKETKNEFNEIIYGTLTEPKYIFMHIKESIKATFKQLTLFAIGDGNGSFLEGTLLHERVSKYFYHDLSAYSSSRQNQSQLNHLNLLNYLFQIIIVLSLISSLVLLTKYFGTMGRTIKVILLLFLIGILINAWDCGTFANAIDRLGCKMIWLLPLSTILLILKIKMYKKETNEINESQ